jgi:hypothetical protein
MFYPFPLHYLYDFLVLTMTLIVTRQVFNLKLNIKQYTAFVSVMMFFYQFNFLVIERQFPKEVKYVTLYIGFMVCYMYIVKLKFLPALIITMCTTAFNGIWTNINLFFMLSFLFPTYEVALEFKHLQYTCYTFTVLVLSALTLLFRFRIFDIQRYN